MALGAPPLNALLDRLGEVSAVEMLVGIIIGIARRQCWCRVTITGAQHKKIWVSMNFWIPWSSRESSQRYARGSTFFLGSGKWRSFSS